MSNTEIIILFVVIAIVIGIIMIIFSGFFVVKENHISIFEKLYKFYVSKEKGVYFFTPFITRRVGNYTLEKQYLKLNLKKTSIYVIYQINDAIKYHYERNGEFKELLLKELLRCEENNLNLEESANNFANNLGITIIGFKKSDDSLNQ